MQTTSSVARTGDGALPHGRLHGIRALVVDNDVASATDLCALLLLEGCDARNARSAEEALALLAAFPAHAVVFNLVLPRMSGLLLARRLRAAPETCGLLLFSTSPAQWGDAEQIARQAGCVAHLPKPVNVNSFADRLTHLVKGRS